MEQLTQEQETTYAIDTLISEIESIEIPKWIEGDGLTVQDVEAIVQGGCASGAYMPAVCYNTALKTMGEHGDDIFEYIDEVMGELPSVPKDSQSWSGMAVYYLSVAVELWALGAYNQLEWAETI
jgi:hypothetical protein